MNEPIRFECLFHGTEIFLAYATKGAGPVRGDVLESGARGNAVLGIAFDGVILITTNVANVLFHVVVCLKGLY